MQKLLLADDSVTIQRVIELTFSGEDIQVVAVNDGEQAIARIPAERPDIVLADIGMPKKGGYDVAAFVKGRADLEHIPVLLLAGAFEPVDQARAEQVRCDGVLIKPFEPRQVIERVRWDSPPDPTRQHVTLSSGGWWTMHGDFWQTWHQAELAARVKACFVHQVHCSVQHGTLT